MPMVETYIEWELGLLCPVTHTSEPLRGPVWENIVNTKHYPLLGLKGSPEMLLGNRHQLYSAWIRSFTS